MEFESTVFPEEQPLHYAAELGDAQQVRALLASGTPVDSRTSGKVTPLMVAAKRGFDDIVELLLKAGANVNAKDAPKQEDEGRLSALMLAAEAGHDSTCRLLLEAGADPNSASQWGNTALNFACTENHLSVVETLLRLGANPNGSMKSGSIPPLDDAAVWDSLPLLRALLSAGADPNRVASEFPLLITKSVECVRELLRFGANVNLKDAGGQTALCRTVATRSLQYIKCLIEAGADVNLPGNGGVVPLMELKWGPRVEVAKLLVEAGANVNYVCQGKWAILDWVGRAYHDDDSPAKTRERAQIVELLRSRGAKTLLEQKDEG